MEMIIASLWLLVNKSCGAQSMGQAVHWASPLKRVSNHLRCWETILANRRKVANQLEELNKDLAGIQQVTLLVDLTFCLL